MSKDAIKLIECPRDAMQGWKTMISTEKKVSYINSLLKVGFDTIDFGSFVSPKAIPQMADTALVLKHLDTADTKSKLLAIVANPRGANDAALYDEIKYLGYPFSVSPTFQMRNTNATMEESLVRVEEIQHICVKSSKQLVVYLSMGFGNPYGDAYSEEIVYEWAEKLATLQIKIISIADTVGLATAEQVSRITKYLVDSMTDTEIGVHLHSTPDNWKEKLEAAVQSGCKRFDGALKGIGGCPMADDELVGNMDTEKMITWFEENGYGLHINKSALNESLRIAADVFI